MDEPLFEILRVLSEREVEYIIVGGVAAVLQGAPIMTFDLDILHRRTPENVARLLAALRSLNATYRTDHRGLIPTEAHLLGPGHQLLKTRHGVLDVLGAIEDDTRYEDVVAATETFILDELSVRVLTLPRLIAAKERTGRSKDLAVLAVLRATLAERDKGER